MKKEHQQQLLTILNQKAKLKEAYAKLDQKISKLAHINGPDSICIEVDDEMRNEFKFLNISDKQKYFRMSLIDNADIFTINEADEDTPAVMYRVAKFSRFEIEGKALIHKPKDME